MSEERPSFKLSVPDVDRPYEEVAAEYQVLLEKQARLWALERWREFRSMKAAPEAEKAPAGELPAVASFW